MGLLFVSNSSFADNPGISEIVNYNECEGYVDLEFLYWRSSKPGACGGIIDPTNRGFSGSGNYIYINGTKVAELGTSDGLGGIKFEESRCRSNAKVRVRGLNGYNISKVTNFSQGDGGCVGGGVPLHCFAYYAVVRVGLKKGDFGQTLSFRMTGDFGGSFDNTFSGTQSAINFPEPYNLNTEKDCGQVKLSWSKPNKLCSNTSIEIYRNNSLIHNANVNDNQYYDNVGYDPNEHDYKIRLRFEGNHGIMYSDFLTATGNPYKPVTVPDNFGVTQKGCTKDQGSLAVKLTWAIDSREEPEEFTIYRSEDTSFSFPETTTVSQPYARSFTDERSVWGQLEFDKEYFYKVKVRDICDIEKTTGVQSIILPSQPDRPVIDEVSLNNKNSATIKWSHNGARTTQYAIYRDNEVIKQIDVADREFTDNDITNCEIYSYKVVAENDCFSGLDGNFSASQEIEVEVNDNINEFEFLKASKGFYTDRVKLSWNYTGPNTVEEFAIFRRLVGVNNNYQEIGRLDSPAELWDDLDVTVGEQYQYAIIALDCDLGSFRPTFDNNTITAIGFRSSYGVVNGKVTYKGGNAVEGVRITASPADDIARGVSLDITRAKVEIPLIDQENNRWFDDNSWSVGFWQKPGSNATGQQILKFDDGTDQLELEIVPTSKDTIVNYEYETETIQVPYTDELIGFLDPTNQHVQSLADNSTIGYLFADDTYSTVKKGAAQGKLSNRLILDLTDEEPLYAIKKGTDYDTIYEASIQEKLLPLPGQLFGHIANDTIYETDRYQVPVAVIVGNDIIELTGGSENYDRAKAYGYIKNDTLFFAENPSYYGVLDGDGNIRKPSGELYHIVKHNKLFYTKINPVGDTLRGDRFAHIINYGAIDSVIYTHNVKATGLTRGATIGTFSSDRSEIYDPSSPGTLLMYVSVGGEIRLVEERLTDAIIPQTPASLLKPVSGLLFDFTDNKSITGLIQNDTLFATFTKTYQRENKPLQGSYISDNDGKEKFYIGGDDGFGALEVSNVTVESEEQLTTTPLDTLIRSRYVMELKYQGNKILETKELYTNEYSGMYLTYDGNQLKLFANGLPQDSATIDLKSFTSDVNQLNFGDGTFAGWLDEITAWDIAKTNADVKRDFSRYLSGGEDGLKGYWRVNEAVGDDLYDAAFDKTKPAGTGFYEHHGLMTGGSWSTEVPEFSQLSYSNYTDKDGNYSIPSIIYDGVGQNFQVVPIFGKHEFTPTNRVMFIGASAQIHNEIDFEDKSSFTVTGTVRYDPKIFGYDDREDIDAPACFVEGVEVLLDNSPIVEEGKTVKTDKYGNFEIEVPIGQHKISLVRKNHTFSIGQWPPTSTHNFVDDVIGLQFYDSTLRKVVGKVVGGVKEGEKYAGFGQIENNIGHAEIVFESLGRSCVKDTVLTDLVTGEYSVELLPLKYKVSSLKVLNGDADFNRELRSLKEGTFDLSGDDLSQQYLTEDEAFQNGNDQDTLYYHTFKDFVYRIDPEIFVLSNNNDQPDFFGETEIEIQAIDPDKTVNFTVNPGDFDFPIFRKGSSYNFKIKVTERYLNHDSGDTFDYDIESGDLDIYNDIAGVNRTYDLSQVSNRDSDGFFTYSFVAGQPNITYNRAKPRESYASPLEIVALNKVKWEPNGEIFRGYILGSKPENSSDFYTVADGDDPYQMVDFVLRDPPGSHSYAYIEEGTSFIKSTKFELSNVETVGLRLELGQKFKIKTPVSESEFKNTVYGKVEGSKDLGISKAGTEEIKILKKIQTSAEPRNTGADSDLFVGSGRSISVPLTHFVEFIPVGSCNDQCIGPEYKIDGKNYRVGKTKQYSVQIQNNYKSEFIYTRVQIEQEIKALGKSLNNMDSLTNPVEYSKLKAQSAIWKKVLGYDEAQKLIALSSKSESNTRQYSFGYGSKLEESYSLTKKDLSQSHERFATSFGFGNDILINAGGVFFQFNLDYKQLNVSNQLSTVSSETEKKIGYVLEDKDVGDKFDVQVVLNRNEKLEQLVKDDELWQNQEEYFDMSFEAYKSGVLNHWSGDNDDIFVDEDDFFNSYMIDPVYYTTGGRSACPYEPEIEATYLDHLDDPDALSALNDAGIDINNPPALSGGTFKRDQPGFRIEPRVLYDVPSDQRAIFDVILENYNTEDTVRYYTIQLDQRTNGNGATMRLDGERFVKGGTPIPMFGGDQLSKKMTLRPIRGIYDYEDIVIYFHSSCQFDFGSDLDFQEDIYAVDTISVYFTPVCPKAEVIQPSNNWIINKASGNTLQAEILENSFFFDNHQKIKLQYKASYQTDQEWTDIEIWTRDSLERVENDWQALPEGNNYIVYDWQTDQFDLVDGRYDLRWYFICQDGTESQSPITSGTIDRTSPHAFGSPQPADGILSPGDEISIKFNEPIESGLITPENIKVKGKLNGSTLKHQVSLAFSGESTDGATIQGVQLAESPFTMEAWVNWSGGGNNEQVIFHHGKENSTRFYFNIDRTGRLVFHMNEQTLTADQPINADEWTHVAFSFDPAENKLMLLADAQVVGQSTQFIETHLGEGIFEIGKAEGTAYEPFEGFMHEVRVWRKYRKDTDLAATFYKELLGRELGLIGYWPLDEGEGSLARDKVQGRNAEVQSNWSLKPDTYGAQLTGGHLEFPGSVAYNAATDFTIEFWFKGNQPSGEATFISTGIGVDGADHKTGWSVNATSLGQFRVINDDQEFIAVDSNFFDNQWHHFALVVNRVANISAFIDGNLQNTLSSDGWKGFGGPQLWMGAHGVISPFEPVKADQQFIGLIDEVRVWELARKQAQIERDRFMRLDGDEIGLNLYVPFEEYDDLLRVVNPSLKDMTTDSEIEGTLVNNVSFTQQTPAIKSKPYMTPIQFDYSTSGDQILITLDDNDPARVENVTLDITVMNIVDQNGNTMESPATWAAYVDRNQVIWSERTLEFRKQLGAPLTFEATILNEGGQEQDFNLHDLPLWLNANPSSGTIGPNSQLKVTFEVNSGLNIGNYNELIYMKADYGFDEILPLNLNVYEEAPDGWSVDPSDYQYSMNFISQLKIDDLFSLDVEDMVAAFVGDSIRGVANCEYVDEYDKYVAFLNVYSNELSGEDITFRIWDASEGKIHIYPEIINASAETLTSLPFQADKIHGTLSSPVIFNTSDNILKEIEMPEGWKWVAFNLESDALNRSSTLLSSIENEEGDLIMAQSGQYDTYDATGATWIGNLAGDNLSSPEGLKPEASYRIYNQSGEDLVYWGKEADPSSTSIAIEENIWNWIGFLGNRNIDVNEALASLNPADGDIIKSQYEFAIYDPALHWVGSLKSMKPDEGYMIKTNKGTLVYPKAGLVNSRLTSEPLVASEIWNFNPHEFGSNMSVVAKVKGVDVNQTGVLGAFVGNQCRGISSPQNIGDQNLFFMSIAGDNTGKVEFSLHDANNNIISLNGVLDYRANDVVGTLEEPLVLIASSENQLVIAPNPFENEISIYLHELNANNLEVSMFDMMGKEVYHSNVKTADNERIDINLSHESDITAGVYRMVVKNGEELMTSLIVKK